MSPTVCAPIRPTAKGWRGLSVLITNKRQSDRHRGRFSRAVQAQASFLGYMDVFWLPMVISLLTAPLALTMRKSKLGGAAPVGH
jgi:hypothetical protein